MSAPALTRTDPPPRPQRSPRAALPVGPAVAAGTAVLLAGAPVGAIVQGATWFGRAIVVVAVVVLLGLALHRFGTAVATIGQAAGVVAVVTAMYADGAVLGVLPGPTALGSFGQLLDGAGQQIAVGIAPVAATPEILFLVTAAFGTAAVAVYAAAVPFGAPAAAGVPLLAVFAVPAALSDQLLPWWAMVGAAAGFGLLLLARTGAGRQLGGGTAVVGVAVVLALGLGAVTGFVGTAGRFAGSGGSGAGGAIGLAPFTSLRGQLTKSDPSKLFEIRGLPQPTYMRALTLRDYVPDAGWQATRPERGPALPGPVAPDPGPAGKVATAAVQNVGFRDYWLPLFGSPIAVSGVTPGQFAFDARSATAYTSRPREEDSWQQTAALAAPTAEQLRAATRGATPGPDYLNTQGVDGRVVAIARQVTAGRATAFDKAMALQDFFAGSGTAFSYSLQTRPGNGDDALVEFLTVGKQGYCEQFSAAMAVMLRTVGVPARVAVGFTGGTEFDGVRTITTADAHAWVEAWFPGYGWITFDPTPLTDGRAITPPYVLEAQAAEAGVSPDAVDPKAQQGQNSSAVPTLEPTTTPAVPTDAPTAAPAADGGLSLWPIAAVLAVLAAVAIALLPAGLRARDRHRRLTAVGDGGPGAAGAAWAEVLAESADRGVPARGTDTVRGTARRLVQEHGLDAASQDGLRTLVSAVEASWYADRHPEPGELAGAVRQVRQAITEASPLSWKQRVAPRSVTGRLRRTRKERPESDERHTPDVTPARSGAGSAPPSDR